MHTGKKYFFFDKHNADSSGGISWVLTGLQPGAPDI